MIAPDPDDKELLRRAVARARSIPASLNEEQAVRKIIQVRKSLDKELRDKRDPRVLGARLIKQSLTISISAATLISAIGIWRVLERFTTPLGVLDHPVPFLVVFTLLFLLSWIPVVRAALRARKLVNTMPRRPEIDTTRELRAYDVAVVKTLLKDSD